MRNMRRSRSRRRLGRSKVRSVPEVVSEDEQEEVVNQESETYEFDVHLKVWRRSRANMWRSPSFD